MVSERAVEVFIEENTPRDGIQNEAVPFTIEERVHLVDGLSECGFRRIQIGSFVDQRRLPQMAHTEEVCERIRHRQGVVYSVLVLNRKGLARALACGIKHLSVYVSASETHSRKNAGCSVGDAMAEVLGLIQEAKGKGLSVRAGVMNAFGCRFEGHVPPEVVVKMVKRFIVHGADEISLADTPGVGRPETVTDLVRRTKDACDAPVSLHLHDSSGIGLANVRAAWKAGVKSFDSSCGGLGGCPFVPSAPGNIPTEDLVHLFESMGVETGISPSMLSSVVQELERKLGRPLGSRHCGLEADGLHAPGTLLE